MINPRNLTIKSVKGSCGIGMNILIKASLLHSSNYSAKIFQLHTCIILPGGMIYVIQAPCGFDIM